MKFRGHETFFIRKGWLGKGMKNVNSRPDVFVSKEKKPMDVLGISLVGFYILSCQLYMGLLTHLNTQILF